MNKELKDYIHYYLGCECANSWFQETHDMYINSWRLIAIDRGNPKTYGLSNGDSESWTESIMPVLRKLDSLTDDELKERQFSSRDHYKRWLFANERAWPIDDLHWFLKNGFDVFDLIREGLALDKATLK